MAKKPEPRAIFEMNVHGGRGWVAAIKGRDKKFKYAREFEPSRDVTGSGNVYRQKQFALDDGLYEISEQASARRNERSFAIVRGGKIKAISADRAERRLAAMERLTKAKASRPSPSSGSTQVAKKPEKSSKPIMKESSRRAPGIAAGLDDNPRAPAFKSDPVPVRNSSQGIDRPLKGDALRAVRAVQQGGGMKSVEKMLGSMSSRARADIGGQIMGGDVRKWSEMSVRQQAEVIAKAEKASTAARTSDIGRGAAAVTRSPRPKNSNPPKRMTVQSYVDQMSAANSATEARTLARRAASQLTLTEMNQAGAKMPWKQPLGIDVVDAHLDARLEAVKAAKTKPPTAVTRSKAPDVKPTVAKKPRKASSKPGSIAALKAQAKERGISLAGAKSKAQIEDRLRRGKVGVISDSKYGKPPTSGLIGFQNESTQEAAQKGKAKAAKPRKAAAPVTPQFAADRPYQIKKDIRGIPTTVKIGANGDPFTFKSQKHQTTSFDADGYPSKTEIVKATTRSEYVAKLDDIDKARRSSGLDPLAADKKPTVKAMRAEAKSAGITNASKMNKSQLMKLRDAGKFSITALIAAPAVAAAIAYDSTRSTALASGKGGTAATGDALKAAAGAGAGAAAVTGTIVGGMKLAAKAAPAVAKVASRAFLPLTAAMAAYEVGRGAVAGYAKGGVSGAIQGGAMGGADFLTFGGASYVANRKVRGEGQREAVNMASRGLKKADRKPRDPKSDGFVEGFTRRQGGKMVTVQTRKMTAEEMTRRFGA